MSGLKVFMQWLNKKNIYSRYQVCYSKAKGIERPSEWRQKREEAIQRSLVFMTTSQAQYPSHWRWKTWKLKELLTALQFIWLNVLGGFVLNQIIHTLYKVYKSVYMFCHVTLILLVDFVNSNNSIHISIHQQNTYYTVCSKLRLWSLLIEKRRKQVLTIIFIWFWSLINYILSIKC